MEFLTEFTIIGDDETQTFEDLAKAAPATVVAIHHELFEERGEPWERGEHVGEADGTAVVTQRGVAVCHLTFALGDEDTLVALGVLPIDGRTLGGGRLAVAGGTGRFNKASGTLIAETRNPKRWSFYL